MDKDNTVRIIGKGLPISTKFAVEISNHIRGKSVQWAKKQLSLVADKKIAIRLRRFNRDRGHKPGMAGGCYPINASKEIIKLLTSLEGYAQHNNLDKNNLFIKAIMANRAASAWHPGRIRGIHMKSTNIEIIAEEKKKKEVKKGAKK